jgi:hypothetical protein
LNKKIEEVNNKTIIILLLTQGTREIWMEKEKYSPQSRYSLLVEAGWDQFTSGAFGSIHQ